MSLVISKRSLMAGSLMLLANLLISAMAVAEQKETLGKWDVHYIAFNSTFITPDIAKHYSIVRSKYNGVINISVLNNADQKAQSAVLTGTARNLLGVSKSLTFKEVSEGDAIYYIAVLPFSDQETFRITVNINDGTDQQVLKFQHKFYAE
ncbi:DUF4426 domain-containing protein [Paraglaciecola agarilytica]|uniref:DUF4426 domain-containing protein n=1 Tax=Paraglaciecola chathamensis TaxID=368405 RepID=UPI001C086F24|nr:DUF4426 domain-containing protein [Paraglaciecola agarilytica]MBU3018292.1 DUF4426 domain-containing protein [Paraglaciecola agarilytica]